MTCWRTDPAWDRVGDLHPEARGFDDSCFLHWLRPQTTQAAWTEPSARVAAILHALSNLASWAAMTRWEPDDPEHCAALDRFLDDLEGGAAAVRRVLDKRDAMRGGAR